MPVNRSQRFFATEGIVSVTIFPRFKRAYPSMSWYVAWYAQFNCAMRRFSMKMTVVTT
eukprot:CAMPEP_0115437980 /NCGR_PEP_ID=MMETSP0271-20121206/35019_1 /TAXON_ID=71861 /ORGANISM="Scrippsiella trochoidea, Strain CCMP3099" /LENGTH=57 /DNA_ID=CAMNT_0002863615 /DNA_START=84 /DNA_END=257 /DNA_ORIENTATION=-